MVLVHALFAAVEKGRNNRETKHGKVMKQKILFTVSAVALTLASTARAEEGGAGLLVGADGTKISRLRVYARARVCVKVPTSRRSGQTLTNPGTTQNEPRHQNSPLFRCRHEPSKGALRQTPGRGAERR